MPPPAQPALAAVPGAGVPAWLHKIAAYKGLIVPIAFIAMLAVIVVPLPPAVMDVLIALNISLSVIILLTTIYMQQPLDFSVFPSLLLGTTLLRLVLNVASTRLILSANAATPDEALGVAGHVISAFAEFVAGESLTVGIILFLILVIVQFVVITKGATRISEVAARFTLDAMPGKQMAIDADLNAGVINEAEARRRRERISQEADFFGAMDGASKFVRGDAIAGLIITAVNVIGGIAIGAIERGWPIGQTASVFTRLTIGDGLTAQIPAFVIAIASALIVTRSGSRSNLGDELANQLTSQPTGLFITAGFLGALALTPLPTIPLILTAAALTAIGLSLKRSTKRKAAKEQQDVAAKTKAPEAPTPESLLKLDTLELEVGYGLVALVDTHQGGTLLDRISAARRQLAIELGFIMPPVRIRDNLQIPSNEYRVKVKGNPVSRGQTMPGKLLAMDPGIASSPIEGIPTREPAFGLAAWWIDPALRARAESLNYTVVDPTSVITTHLTEVVRQHAEELLTREEVNHLVAQLREKAPKLVEEVVPAMIKPGELQHVLQNLLRERVPIRDLEIIIETLADWAPRSRDVDVLTEYARNALRRTISLSHATPSDNGKYRLACVTVDPALEDTIASHIDRSGGSTTLNIPPRTAAQITTQIRAALKQATDAGHQPVLITSPHVRAAVRQLILSQAPHVAVLGYNEIIPEIDVDAVAMATPASPQALRDPVAA